MPDWKALVAIAILGLVSFALRAGGFLAVGAVPDDHLMARFLRLAPGNLFVAFVVAGCVEGGWPTVLGSAAALATMIATKKEWAALGAGFAIGALATVIRF